MTNRSQVFLSYRRNDAAGHARALHRELCRRFDPGFAFFDRASIEAGEGFPERLRAAVDGCVVALVLIAPGWLDARATDGGRRLDDPDDFVRREVALALALDRVVIPVLLDDTPMPDESALPDELKPLARRDAFTLRGKAYEYERQLEDFVRTLARLTGVAPWKDNLGIAVELGDNVAIYRQVEYLPVRLRAPRREAFRPLIEDRQRFFGGRRDAVDRVMSFIANVDAGYAVITAPAGFGKTALVANLVGGTPDAFAYHFFTPLYGEDTLSEEFFLRNVLEQMAAWRGEIWDLPATVEELRAAYQRTLGTPLAGTGVLLLDGLDEVRDWTLAPFLSRRLPGGLRVIATVRDVGQDWRAQFQLPSDQVTEIALPGLDRAGVAAVLRTADGRGAVPEAEPATSDAVFALAGGTSDGATGADPFYVRFLVEDLAERRLTAETITTAPKGLDAYLDRWWQEIRGFAGDAPTRDLFGTLSVAAGPIARQDLEAINPGLADAWLADRFDEVLARVRRLVVRDASGGYSLLHPRLREYMQRKTRAGPFRARLLELCRGWRGGSRYALAHYGAHLAEAGDWHTLRDLVATESAGRAFLDLRREVESSHAGFLRDLDLAWRHAEEMGASDVTAVADQIRCALVASSIRTMSGRLTARLIAAALRHGLLPVRAALDQAGEIPEPVQRVTALAQLLPQMDEEQRIRVCESAVAAAKAMRADTRRPPGIVLFSPPPPIRELDRRGDALEPIAMHLSGALREEALALVRELDRPVQIPRLLAALATGLLSPQREALIDEAFRAVQRIQPRARGSFIISAEVSQARALVGMSIYLEEPRRNEVCRLAVERAMQARYLEAVWTLVELLPNLPGPVAAKAAGRILVNASEKTASRLKHLAAAAPFLTSAAKRAAVVEQIRSLIAAGADVFESAIALAACLPLVPEPDRARRTDEAFVLASALESDKQRSEAYAQLAMHTEGAQQSRAVQLAAEAAARIDREEEWVTAVARLIPFTSAEYHRTLLDKAATLEQGEERQRLLEAAAPLLDRETTARALALARILGDGVRYAPAQETDDVEVVWQTEEEGEEDDFDLENIDAVPRPTTIERARAIHFDLERVAGLALLAPALPEAERERVLAEAFRDALRINDQERRHTALRAVARQLAEMPRARVYPLWLEGLRAGGSRFRAGLVSDLDALRPLLRILDRPDAEPEVAAIVAEMRHWFP